MDTSRPRGRDSLFPSDDRSRPARSTSPTSHLHPGAVSQPRDSSSERDGSDSGRSHGSHPRHHRTAPSRLVTEKPSYIPQQLARQRHITTSVARSDAPFTPTSPVRNLAPLPQDRHSSQHHQQEPSSSLYSYGSKVAPRGHNESHSEHSHEEYTEESHSRSPSPDYYPHPSNATRREDGSASSDGQEEGGPNAPSSPMLDSPQPRYQLRRLTDQPFVPHIVPPPYRYGQERYPAYDSNARRIGLDHVRYENAPPSQASAGNYYRPRTHTYPAPNAGKDAPRVMTLSLNPLPSQQEPLRASPEPVLPPEVPLQDMETPVPTPGPSSAPNTARDPISPVVEHCFSDGPTRTDRRVTTGRAQTALPASGDVTDGTPHLREMLGLGPGDPVDLNSLGDPPPGVKPSYPYPVLIQLAINGSPRKRLTLSEIYTAIEERFEWFRTTQDKAWQGSIRHTLSLKSCFRTISRPITEPGKGNYWIVDFSMGDGNKRPRKRNPRPKKAERLRMAAKAARQEREEGEESSDGSMVDTGEHRTVSQISAHDDDDDPNIDPQLKNQGHAVGEPRALGSSGSVARRVARRGSSPYSAPPPVNQTSRNPRPPRKKSSVPTVAPVTSWGSGHPSNSIDPSYDLQPSFSSARSALHPSLDTSPRSEDPNPKAVGAAPSNWAPYGGYSSFSSRTLPPLSSTRQSSAYTRDSHSPTLPSLSTSTRPYVTTQSYTSNTRTTSSRQYEQRYDRREPSSSRPVEPRQITDSPPRRSAGLHSSPDWEKSAPRRRKSYDYSSASSED